MFIIFVTVVFILLAIITAGTRHNRVPIAVDLNGKLYYSDGLEHLPFGVAYADEACPQRLVSRPANRWIRGPYDQGYVHPDDRPETP
jgi:hypothetical protein